MIDAGTFEYHFKKVRNRWKTYFTDEMAIQVYDIVKNVPLDDFAKWCDNVLWSKEAPQKESLYNLVRTSSYRGTSTTQNEISHLQVFTEDERKQNWDLMWDIFHKRVSKEEIKERLDLVERAIQIAQENERKLRQAK